MPSNVVYHETTESKQLATKSAWTIGRLTPASPVDWLEDTNAMARYSLRTLTRRLRERFQNYSTTLLRSQRRHRIALDRTPRRDVTGGHSKRSQNHNAQQQGPHIARACAVNQASKH